MCVCVCVNNSGPTAGINDCAVNQHVSYSNSIFRPDDKRGPKRSEPNSIHFLFINAVFVNRNVDACIIRIVIMVYMSADMNGM